MPPQPLPGEHPPAEHAEELLAMVAHELRQPLTALLGALMTLQHHTQALSRPQQQELLGMDHRKASSCRGFLISSWPPPAWTTCTPPRHGARWSMWPPWPRRPATRPGWPIPTIRSPSTLLGRWRC